jgi:chemotaxis signal transduction protein
MAALELNALFNLNSLPLEEGIHIICSYKGSFVSLRVDKIREVISFPKEEVYTPPEIIPPKIRSFLKGIYKKKDLLIPILDLKKIVSYEQL